MTVFASSFITVTDKALASQKLGLVKRLFCLSLHLSSFHSATETPYKRLPPVSWSYGRTLTV